MLCEFPSRNLATGFVADGEACLQMNCLKALFRILESHGVDRERTHEHVNLSAETFDERNVDLCTAKT